MIIAKRGQKLLIPLADAGADRVRRPEIERRAGNVSHLSGGNELCIDRREPLGGEHHFVFKDVGTRCTAQVEIGVIGEIDDGRSVGFGAIVDP